MKGKNMNYSLPKHICIGMMLSFALTGRLFAAAPQEMEHLPVHIEQQIVEAALTTQPYSKLVQWLVQLYETIAAIPIATLSGHTDWIKSVAISPDGSKIVTGSDDKTAKIWNVADGSLIATLSGHTAEITSVAISSDGSKVVTGSKDGTAKIWNMSDGSLYYHLTCKTGILDTFGCNKP